MKRSLLKAAAMAVVGLACIPNFAAAQDEAETPDLVSGTFATTFTTDYISRGIVLENQGLIAQPSIELSFNVIPDAGFAQNISVYGGIWNSLHSNHEFAADEDTEVWYEFDWYVGVGATFADRIGTRFTYWEFISPSDAFGTAKNYELKVTYSDAGLISEDFSINPYAVVFVETDGKAGTGSDEGVYVELGIGPSFAVEPVTLTFPIFTGIGFSNFYGSETDASDNETFGYAAAGVVASTPLEFLAPWGSWRLSAGVYFYYFGDGTEWANDAGAYTDKEWDVMGQLGISCAF